MTYVTVNCAVCAKPFQAKKADRARGWAKCCSKSCAASKRERKTGNYRRFLNMREAARSYESEGEFADAHLFSNEEHDCNKE